MSIIKSIQKSIESKAFNTFKDKTAVQEHWVLIVLLFGIKLITMLVSLFCGYTFYNHIISSLVGSNTLLNGTAVVSILSIVMLVILEVITASLLVTLFRRLVTTKVGIQPIALMLIVCFTVSFFTSVKGIEMQVKGKVKTSQITSDYQGQGQVLKEDFEKEKLRLIGSINSIKANPTIWQGSKRTLLSTKQQNRINTIEDKISLLTQSYNNSVLDLKESKKVDISKDIEGITVLSGKYKIYVSIILILQLLVNYALIVYLKKVFVENEGEQKLYQKQLNDLLGVTRTKNV